MCCCRQHTVHSLPCTTARLSSTSEVACTSHQHPQPGLTSCVSLCQVAVIEYARSICGLKEANSTEFDSATTCPAVVFMPEGSKTHKGGTMRLGSRRTLLETVDCITAKLYQVRWCLLVPCVAYVVAESMCCAPVFHRRPAVSFM